MDAAQATEALPVTPRFNTWGEWKPIIAHCSTTEYSRIKMASDCLPSPHMKAIFLYTEFTGCTGIEFVLVSNTEDKARFRRLPNGIIIVPCPQPLFSGMPDASIYDGWMPLGDNSTEAITKALSDLDEVLSVWSHVLESSTRLFVKYVECVGGRPPLWHVEDNDYEGIARSLARLRDLPMALQTAVVRSLHWRQHARAQVRLTDKLLALWQAFESLLAATYDHAADIELPLDDATRSLSKRQRNKVKAEFARQIIQAELEVNPLEAVKRAYFEAVVGIRRRCEAALRAMLSADDPRVQQMFDTAPAAWSPNRIRNLLMHEGCSATEVELQTDLRSQVEALDKLLGEIIARVLRRSWRGEALGTRSRNASISQNVLNSITCAPTGGVIAQGNFLITYSLLTAKGLY